MQNKCNCSCNGGFVPVDGNWDFNNKGNGGCQQNYGRRMNRRGNGYKQCGEYENDYNRDWDKDGRSGSDSQCERCDDDRQVACCEKNTYIRDMDTCECKGHNGYARNYGCTHGDDCQCEQCTRNRSRRNNSCQKCGDCEMGYNYGCSGNDGWENKGGCKDNDNGTTYARSHKNRKVGMVNVEMQEIDEIFESESALRAGTLFPELHKPMNGYCPYDGNCGTSKQQAVFAAWELRLYLNTHPNDKEALALFRKLCKEVEEPNYATSFLKDDGCSNGWNWVKNPWPWEYDCHCGD